MNEVLLKEGLVMYQIYVLLKTKSNYNKIEIYNQIRALKGVVVCTIENNDFLKGRQTKQFEYSLLRIKYICSGDPISDAEMLKTDAMTVRGILQFIPRPKTLIKKGAY